MVENKDLFRNWSISETRKRGETVIEAAIRALKEEADCDVTAEQVEPKKWIEFPEPKKHESSVYCRIWTNAFIQWVWLDLPNLPWPERSRVSHDNGVEIHLEWIRIPEISDLIK